MLSITATAANTKSVLHPSRQVKPLRFGENPENTDVDLKKQREEIEKEGFAKSSWGIMLITMALLISSLIDACKTNNELTQNIDQYKQLSQQHDALAEQLGKEKEENPKLKAEQE